MSESRWQQWWSSLSGDVQASARELLGCGDDDPDDEQLAEIGDIAGSWRMDAAGLSDEAREALEAAIEELEAGERLSEKIARRWEIALHPRWASLLDEELETYQHRWIGGLAYAPFPFLVDFEDTYHAETVDIDGVPYAPLASLWESEDAGDPAYAYLVVPASGPPEPVYLAEPSGAPELVGSLDELLGRLTDEKP